MIDRKKHLFTLMTRPDGLPANVPNKLVSFYIDKKGFKKGYTAPVEKPKTAKKGVE